MCRRGLLPLRVRAGGKVPVDQGWSEASWDAGEIDRMFAEGEFNVGLRCGPQPCGWNLVVIDVDVAHDGLAVWTALCAEHGGIPGTVVHITPSGGLHIFFLSPVEIRNSARQIAPGVDVRGSGGQVVFPPSWRVVDGVRRLYTEADRGLWRPGVVVAEMPDWLVGLCLGQVERSVARHPSGNGHAGPADWLRDHWDWVGVLVDQGHTLVRRSDRDVYFAHPSATSDHSAVVHLDSNMMNAWSTNMPRHPRGLVNGDGSVPWSPFDWFVATEFGYDVRAASAEINRRRGVVVAGTRPWTVGDPGSGTVAGSAAVPVGDTVHHDLYLPGSVWEFSDLLSTMFSTALSRQVCPDAVLSAWLSMYATTIPMNVWLPAVVGANAPLNLFGVVAGLSGRGKTSAMSLAGDLLGDPGNPDIRLRQGLRSGEGLITKVLRRRKGDDDTAPAHYVGVHVHYDEGGALARQVNQTTSTIMPYMNTAWSGAGTVGGGRADSDLGFPASQVRICATIGVQFGIGANLFVGEAATLGFPQRLLWLMADRHPALQDVEMPDEIVPVSPLSVPFLAHAEFTRPTLLELPRAVRQEIWDWSKGVPDPYDSHLMNLRLRIAAVLMIAHGAGTDDFTAFWDLSGDLCHTHRAVRGAFVNSIAHLTTQRNRSLGQGDEERKQAAYEYALDRAVESLMAKLTGHRVMNLRQVKDHLRAWHRRSQIHYREVIERAILLGMIDYCDGGIRKI